MSTDETNRATACLEDERVAATSSAAGPVVCEPLEGRTLFSTSPVYVYEPHSSYAGKTMGQWAAEWVKWALSAPAKVNPLTDKTGANADVGQPKNVYFLAGTLGTGSVKRTVTAPAGVPLFFPILNDFWVNVDRVVPHVYDPADPPFAKNESKIRAGFDETAKGYENMFLTIDNQSVKRLKNHLEEDPKGGFQVPFQRHNVFDLPADALGKSATQGVYLMVGPLKRGHHTIHFGGTSMAYDPDVKLDITYSINVVSKGDARTTANVQTTSATPALASAFATRTSSVSGVLDDAKDDELLAAAK